MAAERVLSKPPRGAPPVEARIYLTRSEIVSLVILSWITADRPLAAAVAALAETTLAMGLRPTGEEAAGMPCRAAQAPRQRCGPRRGGVKRP